MASFGLPSKAKKQYDALLDNPLVSATRKTTLRLLVLELEQLEGERDSLQRRGGSNARNQHWKVWCRQRRLATEMKTAIKHLLNVWTPEMYE